MKANNIGIIGKKLGMTQVYDNDKMVGVTVIDFSDMALIGKRTIEKDGYSAAILGYDYDKNNQPKFVKEIRIDESAAYDNEGFLTALEKTKQVDIVGTMKGRGFTGVMKRHGFHGGPASHGAKHWHRRPGSVGGHTYPAKTWKGQKMPGHYGNTRVCTLNQQVIKVDVQNRLIFVKGSVPGARNSYVIVRDSVKE